MKRSSISLNDFPDEILLTILRNLPNLDVLYSFYGVSQRFTRIVQDQIFVRHLTFAELCGKRLHHFTSNEMLDRLCSQVLPSISHEIVRFDLDSSSINEVFHAAHYSNLSHLSLYNLTEESARFLFNGTIVDFFSETRADVC